MSFLRIPPETPHDRARFDSKWVETPEGCHRWTGFIRSKEYGGFQIGPITYRAHRVAYVWATGDQPATDLHHTCGNAWCVNPSHLRPATIAEPQPRHRGEYEHLCAHGHEFDGINSRGEQTCSICLKAASDKHRDANRDEINAKRREKRVKVSYDERPCEHCGRPFTPERLTGIYCDRKDCENDRQGLNRLRRLGREDEYVAPEWPEDPKL